MDGFRCYNVAMPFAESLLSWYQAHRRHLPWREDPTPYHVYLSETMLQQTRVDTVIPYFNAFTMRLPDFVSLASAEEETVLSLWQGLGYYSRARNLHAAAKIVANEYQGVLPRDPAALLSLPGVGEYMRNAVLAIAFDEPYVAVDGNLLRVYSRLEAKAIDVTKASVRNECADYFGKRMKSPSSFNQALMDLGELICLPHGAPKCEECPLKPWCKACAAGNPEEYPPKKKKPAVKEESLTVLLAFDEKGNLSIRKRPETGLLASLYEFPNVSGHLSVCELSAKFPALKDIEFLGEAKHRFSHILWNMKVYVAAGRIEGCLSVPVSEVGVTYSLPTAFLKLLKKPAN